MVDTETIEGATQRNDGTWRKPVRIRKGYNPMETVDFSESRIFRPKSSRKRDESAGEVAATEVQAADSVDPKTTFDANTKENLVPAKADKPASKPASESTITMCNTDPFNCCSTFVQSDEFDIYHATLASNAVNEDRLLVDPRRRLFGVFDGHGGKDMASFASEKIADEFERQYSVLAEDDFEKLDGSTSKRKSHRFDPRPGTALKRAFLEIDNQFLDNFGRKMPTTGSCGLVCFIQTGVVWSAIVGDSRAIIVRQKRSVRGVNITEDQNTSNRSECAKVILRSGDPDAIRFNQSDPKVNRVCEALRRVAGTLMVTRALGDGYLKRSALSLSPYKEKVPYITAKPKVKRIELLEDDAWLVIASDGVWEHMSTDQVAQVVSRVMKIENDVVEPPQSSENGEHEVVGSQNCADSQESSSCLRASSNAAMCLIDAVIEAAASKLRVSVHHFSAEGFGLRWVGHRNASAEERSPPIQVSSSIAATADEIPAFKRSRPNGNDC